MFEVVEVMKKRRHFRRPLRYWEVNVNSAVRSRIMFRKMVLKLIIRNIHPRHFQDESSFALNSVLVLSNQDR